MLTTPDNLLFFHLLHDGLQDKLVGSIALEVVKVGWRPMEVLREWCSV